jgi:hypothetical protein
VRKANAPLAIATMLLASLASAAYAAPCGDDVSGKRVPCRCGDTVVSDTQLTPQDPVVTQRCPLDGLAIRADEYAEGITLNLSGNAIEGSGAGIGIRVDYGGADGARIIGASRNRRGIIRNFENGVVSVASSAIASISRLEVRGNRRTGLQLTIAGVVLDDVVAAGNGDDGIRARGSGGVLINVEASGNGGRGIALATNDATVDAIAKNNGESGIVVGGPRNDLSGAVASGNGRHGIVVRAGSKVSSRTRALGNTRDDLRLNGARIEP